MICVYVAIGQKQSTVAAGGRRASKQHGAMEHTIIVAATAIEPAPLQYIAPYTGVHDGRVVPRQRQHAADIYDDLSKQAVAYREISLLLPPPAGPRGVPGRRVLPPLRLARARAPR